MSKITTEQIIALGETARIAISEADATEYLTYFEQLINRADQLAEIDTEQIEPTTHGIKLRNVMRDDVPNDGLTEEVVFKNAPEQSIDGQFRVPSILD